MVNAGTNITVPHIEVGERTRIASRYAIYLITSSFKVWKALGKKERMFWYRIDTYEAIRK